jgi:hypothetical protein
LLNNRDGPLVHDRGGFGALCGKNPPRSSNGTTASHLIAQQAALDLAGGRGARDLWHRNDPPRQGFREYLAGLLAPRDRNKTLTALAGAEPVAGAQHAAVQRLQFFLSESRWDPERVNAALPQPAPSWPRALRAIRAWLTPWIVPQRWWPGMVQSAPAAAAPGPDELGRGEPRPAPLHPKLTNHR